MSALEDDMIFEIVVSSEEQYSIWPQDKALKPGWLLYGFSGKKDACLDKIAELWTDMSPLSLHLKMQEEGR